MQKNLTIAVIGLGLIGGSILKKLNSSDYNLIGVSRSKQTIDKALEQGLISRGSTNIDVIKDADIVFICTPINKTIPTLLEVNNTVKPGTIITDVASLKGFITDFVNTSHLPINFIGGHPMAGTENRGLDASLADLFSGAKWVLTPSKWVKEEDVNTLKIIIDQLGAKSIIADPQEHDKAVALISHMPLFLSHALFNLIKNYPDKETGELAMKLAASGFRDMTRLSATNPELTIDMLVENKINVLNAFRELIDEASGMEKQFTENEKNFAENCEKTAKMREKMYSRDGKNVYQGLNL